MDAEQDSEGAQRHTDGAESKWRMVLEKEANVQAFDEQISEIHTAEHNHWAYPRRQEAFFCESKQRSIHQ